MKNSILTYTLAAVALFLSPWTVQSQSFYSGGVDGGVLMIPGELTNMNFDRFKMPVAGQFHAAYHFNNAIAIRGTLLGGISSGATEDALSYYEAIYGQSDLRLSINLLGFKPSEKLTRLELDLGIGGMMFNSSYYERAPNGRYVETRYVPATRGSMSLATIFTGGLRFSTPIHRDIALNLGVQGHYSPWNQWLDANDANYIIMPFAGLSYSFKNALKKGEMAVKKEKYESLERDLLAARQEADEEKAKTEMVKAENESQIKELEDKVIELRKKADSLQESRPVQSSARTAQREGDMKWRVIVGSYPSKNLAERFINRTDLETSEMIILHEESLNTWRVVYVSAESLAAARKALDAAKKSVPDAWIIRM